MDSENHLAHDKVKGLLDECDGQSDPVDLLRRIHSAVHVPYLESRCVTYIENLGEPGEDDPEVKTVAFQWFLRYIWM